jgi:hypothetical protein
MASSSHGYYKNGSLLLILLLAGLYSAAHDIIVDVEKMSKGGQFWFYIKTGFEHIIPLGLDHILFVLGLFLMSPSLKPLLWQSLTFTIAHSITLALAATSVIKVPSDIVEPIIALSIAFIAIENILLPGYRKSRLLVVFILGLIHGMGFAGALQQFGIPEKSLVPALVGFNIGVELGQIAVLICAWLLLTHWFKTKENYRKYIVIPLSVIIALVALYWTFTRIF